jgi:hypothetical protein
MLSSLYRSDLFNAYTESGVDTPRNENLRTDSIQTYFGRQPPRCMLTGFGDTDYLTCSHILPHSLLNSKHHLLQLTGLSAVEISNSRNTLLLCTGIEKAFDRLDCSFVQSESDPTVFVLKIWTPRGACPDGKKFHGDVRSLSIFWKGPIPRDSTISEFEGVALNFGPMGIIPYRRSFEFQTQAAFQRAKQQGWLEPDQFCPKFTLSPLRKPLLVNRYDS